MRDDEDDTLLASGDLAGPPPRLLLCVLRLRERSLLCCSGLSRVGVEWSLKRPREPGDLAGLFFVEDFPGLFEAEGLLRDILWLFRDLPGLGSAFIPRELGPGDSGMVSLTRREEERR